MRGEGRQLLPIRRQRQGRLRSLNLLFQVADDALTIVAAELGELHTHRKMAAPFASAHASQWRTTPRV